tara:strand:+ start:580 stop:1158 length:579 start_codon:yes stop_codon:yes gene_type:complete
MKAKWTKAQEMKVVSLWNEGLKIKEIVKKFPNKSYSMVVGKIYKMQRDGTIDKRHIKKGSGRKTTTPPKVSKEVKRITKDVADLYQRWPSTLQYPTPSKETKPVVMDTSAQKIVDTIEEIKSFLLEKNTQYGDSALNPIRIFSTADKTEQIKVRIDDKLNRLVQGSASLESDEDVIKDLIGYLILLLIHIQE